MRKRIEQLLNGEFEYEAPKMNLSAERIHAVIRKGAAFRGSFSIENGEQRRMKGFIYSSSPRMAYEPSAFDGVSEKVVYELDAAGMEEGDVLDGDFTICSELGEYRIPYHIEIARNVMRTSTEVLNSLEEFEALAREDFQKAYPVFLSEGFRRMLKEQAPQWMTMYEGLARRAEGYTGMEEFLVGIHAKEQVSISLEKKHACIEEISQPQQESVVLTKNNWGFQKYEISTDADFLQTEYPSVTTDEFIGSTYRLNYLLLPEKLHAGKNWGRIFIKSPTQTLTYEVSVTKSRADGRSGWRREQKCRIRNLMEKYIDFRLHRISLKEWVNASWEELEAYKNAGGQDPMLTLYRAHLCFAAEEMDDACMILTEFEGARGNITRPEVRGYYLYLTTFYNKERAYIDYVEERLLELFGQDRENWMLQWFLMYLQEYLISHPSEKLEAIREQYICGCRSRIMYLEAYQILLKNPLLLKKLGDFELSLLWFLCREDLLNEELVLQIGDLAGRYKGYSPKLYRILKKCYEKMPSGELIGAICSLLIKGDQVCAEDFVWYERAVEENLRITGLYEHYINSRKAGLKKPLPQMIKMYFAYNNTLSYRKKALVYANVIEYRNEDARTFQSYRPIIERFMVDQLAAGHMNRELALIYRTFLTPSVLTKRLAEYLAGVIFTCQVRCESPNARYVIAMHRQLEEEQRIPLTGKKATVQLYTDDYQIFIEDDRGNRYSASIPYKVERLLEDEELFAQCRNLAPECPEILLHTCQMADGEHPVTEENVGDFCRLLEIDGLREDYRAAVRQELLDYYSENPRSPSLYDFLHEIDRKEFVQTDKGKLLGLLVSEGMSREAFDLVRTYGPEKADAGSLVRMCSRTVLSREFESDEMLLAVCWHCFSHEKYDETVLSYLVKHYDGPVENMKSLWRAGKQFELDTYELEEKILLALVFMRCGAGNTEEIFESYRKNSGKSRLLTAYVIYRAYDYFVREVPVKDPVFTYIENGFEKGRISHEICLLALLRRYAGQKELTEEQQKHTQKLLEEFHYQGKQFAFYKKFGPELLRPFQLLDKSYVEYRANPKAMVTITWHMGGEKDEKKKEFSEIMKNSYEGIFVKEFTLFYGETVRFIIQEEWNGVKKETEWQTLSWDEKNSTGGDTCYDLINRLAKALEEKDGKTVKNVMQLYLEQECLAEHIFPENE